MTSRLLERIAYTLTSAVIDVAALLVIARALGPASAPHPFDS
jgi:hypothetical protein